MWNESEGKSRSNEIVICLVKFMKYMTEKGVKEFCFYSDNCFIFAMWEYAPFTPKIKITHRFLEKGLPKMRAIACMHALKMLKKVKLFMSRHND